MIYYTVQNLYAEYKSTDNSYIDCSILTESGSDGLIHHVATPICVAGGIHHSCSLLKLNFRIFTQRAWWSFSFRATLRNSSFQGSFLALKYWNQKTSVEWLLRVGARKRHSAHWLMWHHISSSHNTIIAYFGKSAIV